MISALSTYYLDDIFNLLIAGQKTNFSLRNNYKALILLYAGQHDSKYLPLWKRIHFSGQLVMQEILPNHPPVGSPERVRGFLLLSSLLGL